MSELEWGPSPLKLFRQAYTSESRMSLPGRVLELSFTFDTSSLYDPELSLDCETQAGTFQLSREVLRFSPSGDFGSVAEAREFIAPYLRAWEVEHAITSGFSHFRFTYLGAETVGTVSDAVTHPPETRTFDAGDWNAELLIVSNQYPSPPRIRVNEEIEAAWERFRYARIGLREPLQSCAYYVLTVVEQAGGGRANAAKRYSIDKEVLRKLGELTSTRGNRLTSRKALQGASTELSRKEEAWIDRAVRLMLLQVGLAIAGETLDTLRLKDVGPSE